MKHPFIRIVITLILFCRVGAGFGQCNAAFTATTLPSGRVLVSSTSTLNSTSVNHTWNFGNGSSAVSGQNVMNAHGTYTNTGIKSITLTLNGSGGCSSSTAQTVTVTSVTGTNCPLTSNFGYTINSGNQMIFSSLSSGMIAGVTYSWDYGNGFGSTGATNTYTYPSTGTFFASLLVNNNVFPACKDSIVIPVVVTSTCNLLVPSFTQAVNAGGVASYTSTSAGTGTNTSYLWQFPTGSATGSVNGTSQIASNTFTMNGVHTVSLTVTDGTCTASTAHPFTVTTAPCSLTAGFNSLQTSSLVMSFTNTSSIIAPGLTTYTWNFGDGTPTVSTTSPSHTYAANGTYTVTLFVNNNVSPACTSSLSSVIVVTTTPCNLTPSFIFAQGPNGLYSFTSTSTGTNSTVSYTWNFGDSGVSTGTNLAATTHTYGANGVYTVQLNISTSAPSCTAVSTQTIAVTTISTPTCNLIAGFSAVQISTTGVFQFSSTSTGTTSGTVYTWNFGTSSGTVNAPAVTTHTFTNNQSYFVTLIVSNSSTCTSTYTTVISLSTTPCSITPAFSYTQGTGGTVTFSNTSTGVGASPMYIWNFGNGGTAATSNIAQPYTYTANGTYTVWLTVTASPGCTASVSHTVLVSTVGSTCTPALAAFTSTLGANGLVSFSYSAAPGFTYTMYYGDGSNGSPPATHVYSANSVYSATLFAVSSSPSCSVNTTQTINVNSICSTMSTAITYTVGSGGQVGFSNVVLGTPVPLSVFWQFGDGDTSHLLNPTHTFVTNGSYTVIVKDSSLWCNSTASAVITITNSAPCSMSANFSHTVGAAGSVTYASSSTGTSGNTIYTWNFGDGTTATGNPISHTYANSGSHLVTLWIQSPFNIACHDSLTQSVNISGTGSGCSANAGFSITAGPGPQQWQIVPSYPWNVSSAMWTWGDGDTTHTLYSSHQYSVAGNYTICLTVIVSCGDTATYCWGGYLSRPGGGTDPIIEVNVITPPTVALGLAALSAEENNYVIFPNPSDGSFNLSIGSITAARATISVFSSTGALVYETESATADGTLMKDIRLDAASNGIYFVKVSAGNKVFTKKLVLCR